MFSEIGDGVEIGDNTRIGMGCFIPKGTYIGREVFIGPKVCFVHDMYPAIDSPKSEWLVTTVGFRASIGANALIRPGINIGNRALIGLGSVVTKDIPAGQIWSGNPARFVRNR
jgi:acetyltransferase-like isoleucine patch superfamily enzyme